MTLEPLPAWQTAVLEPIKVPESLREPNDVVLALSDSSTFQVAGEPRKRSLRLTEALVTTACERGIMVAVQLNQQVRRDGYGRDNPRRDEIEFPLDHGHCRVWFTQTRRQKPHQPTPHEIKRLQYGYLFPDVDYVPADHLGLVLDGEGGPFSSSTIAHGSSMSSDRSASSRSACTFLAVGASIFRTSLTCLSRGLGNIRANLVNILGHAVSLQLVLGHECRTHHVRASNQPSPITN